MSAKYETALQFTQAVYTQLSYGPFIRYCAALKQNLLLL